MVVVSSRPEVRNAGRKLAPKWARKARIQLRMGATGSKFDEESDAASPELVWPTPNLQMWVSRELVGSNFFEIHALSDTFRRMST